MPRGFDSLIIKKKKIVLNTVYGYVLLQRKAGQDFDRKQIDCSIRSHEGEYEQ